MLKDCKENYPIGQKFSERPLTNICWLFPETSYFFSLMRLCFIYDELRENRIVVFLSSFSFCVLFCTLKSTKSKATAAIGILIIAFVKNTHYLPFALLFSISIMNFKKKLLL